MCNTHPHVFLQPPQGKNITEEQMKLLSGGLDFQLEFPRNEGGAASSSGGESAENLMKLLGGLGGGGGMVAGGAGMAGGPMKALLPPAAKTAESPVEDADFDKLTKMVARLHLHKSLDD